MTSSSTHYLIDAAIIAGLAGAALLASALILERATSYASAQAGRGTMGGLAGIDPDSDLARARDTVDARLGIFLLLLAAAGQALAAADVRVQPVVAYEPLLLALFATLAIRETCIRARERSLFKAQMLRHDALGFDNPRFRYDVYCAYDAALSRRGRSISELQPVIDAVTAELGGHPWAQLRFESD